MMRGFFRNLAGLKEVDAILGYKEKKKKNLPNKNAITNKAVF